jgi:hypothetical protein
MMDEVGLSLTGTVSLPDFVKAVRHLRGLMGGLATAVHARRVSWDISELSVNGTRMWIRGSGREEAVDRTARAYGEVGIALQEQRLIPYPIPAVLKNASGLVGLLNHRIDAVVFESAEFDAVVASPQVAREAVEVSGRAALAPAYGAIQGKVQTLTSRGSLHFTLFDLEHDKAVSCYLDPSLEDPEGLMRDAWDRYVIVKGLIRRHPITGRPLTVREIREVFPLDEPNLWGFKDVRGILPRLPEPPEVALRRLRDAW